MYREYDFEKIELKWQEYWKKEKIFQCKEDKNKKKFYLLEMFPYPSGKLHMGHVRNYTIGDTLHRFLRMKGVNVLYPMGYVSLGLPAENAAIKNDSHPRVWTKQCISSMQEQQKRLGMGYDWERLVVTCDEGYYRWNQWLFLKFYEKGLAYKKKAPINWCPSCKTVLANEQAKEGKCWRCDGEVEIKNLEQWFFKITAYAEELLDSLKQLDGWPQRVKTMQKNWIGKSEGTLIYFDIKDSKEKIPVFTTRPDTLYGVTFLNFACEHPQVLELIKGTKQEKEVKEFINRIVIEDKFTRMADDKEKEGIFTGRYAINPVTGEEIPIFVANFVLMDYGTGAVMAVPCHDQRDFEFAVKNKLNLKVVITPSDKQLNSDKMTEAYIEEGVMINSGEFTGMKSTKALEKITEYLEKEGKGKKTVRYKLRDWLISRQRYWGAPIPIIYCDKCGVVPVPQEELPIELPQKVKFTGKGNPLAHCEEFVCCKCPQCQGEARRETDTMDTFVDSSWYFMRYCSPCETTLPFNKQSIEYWMPVDQYIGGIEHAVLHLLYARFFTKVLRDIGLHNIDEPFSKLLCQGMVIKDGAKMSKSLGNVVDPSVIIEKYGADTARLFILFASPPENDLEWSDKGVEGSFRFLNRVWRLVNKLVEYKKESTNNRKEDLKEKKELLRKNHLTIKRVTRDVEKEFHFNTAIALVMELVNHLYQYKNFGDEVSGDAVETVVLLLSPFTPHICEEMWEILGNKESILIHPWPEYDAECIKQEEILIIVQVNGKVRNKILVPAGLEQKEIEQKCLEDDKIKSYVQDKEIIKVISVPKKLVNIVIKN